MPRIAREYQKSICYHVMNRGVNRLNIFEDDTDRWFFLKKAAEFKSRFKVKIYHWALMTNHYHMLIEVAYANLRPFTGGLQQAYAQYHHLRHQSSGVFWQGRFKSKPVEIGDYLVKCGRYIERNPTRAGIEEVPWNYPWSSARFYVERTSDGLTDENHYLGVMTQQDRQAYGEILMSGTEDDWVQSRQSGRVFGSEDFASRIRNERGRPRLKRGRPSSRQRHIADN